MSKVKNADLELRRMNPAKLIPYDNNPRVNEDAVPMVISSIEQFDFTTPIIVSEDMKIIAGHTRQKAALQLGMDEVNVLVVHNYSPEKAKGLRLADNKVAEASGWDFELLDIELMDLDELFDMESVGFALTDFDDEPEEIEVIEDEEDVNQEGDDYPVSQGDVYYLGNITIVCAHTDILPENIDPRDRKRVWMAIDDETVIENEIKKWEIATGKHVRKGRI